MGEVERISSGVKGLDKLLNGGLVKGSTILVSGTAGAGKTIFSSQYLWEGLNQGENCMFITFEELPKDIRKEALLFGWDFAKYEDKGKMFIEQKDPFREKGEELFWFRDEIARNEIERVVLDSTSVLSLYYKDRYEIRRNLFKVIKTLKETGATSLLTTETKEDQKVSRFGVEEYVVDGVISLYFMGVGEKGYRALQVRKMRKIDHSMETHSFKITDKGIKVKKSLI